MTTKPTTNGHAARLLKEVRELFRNSLVFGPEVPPIAREAGRSAPGFGAEMLDAQILQALLARPPLSAREAALVALEADQEQRRPGREAERPT